MTLSAFKNPSFSQVQLIWYTLFILTCLPLAWLVYRGSNSALGVNPVETITNDTGNWALYLLMAALTVTPLRQLSGWHWLARMRRMLGLMAFLYVCLHALTYFWLEQFFDVGAIWQDILTRPFIAVGIITMLLLVPLAVTSWSKMMRMMGGKRWQQLHRLVYVIAILSVVHFWLLKAGKNLIGEPVLFAGIVTVLLGARIARRVWQQRHKTKRFV
jgi:sulfoxide reductase heme-binding subunit YedZ